jgi:hypothetical protein
MWKFVCLLMCWVFGKVWTTCWLSNCLLTSSVFYSETGMFHQAISLFRNHAAVVMCIYGTHTSVQTWKLWTIWWLEMVIRHVLCFEVYGKALPANELGMQ